MKKKLSILSVLTVLAYLSVPVYVHAQDTKIMRESEITESALIDALAPEKSVRTRSFKPVEKTIENKTQMGSNEPLALNEPVSASMSITFQKNSAELTESAKLALDKVGRALNMDKLAEFKFIIEGHADKSGSYQLNQQLSRERAETVMNYLVNRHEVDRGRLAAVGKGYAELINLENPLAPENRRVTLVRIGGFGDKQ